MNPKIFQREIDDGLAELVKAQASVAYCAPVSMHTGTVEAAENIISDPEVLSRVIAENKDQRDLFYLEAVLVSTGWNKNDDVFTAANTWQARATPEDKQFNFMHDENDIIGHITGSRVVTRDGSTVASEEAPKEFDIITQAVLYNSWTQAKNQQRMEQLLSEIPEGKWFVSMECLFAGFDYALIDEKGSAKVLARDEASAFLTKHLRAYGGTGEYEGYKIGRALSNISFSGKGLVSKPANPRSVILSSKSTASFNVENTDSKFSIGEINMSDSVVEKQLTETKAELAKALAEVEAVKAQIGEAKDKEFASKIESYEAAAKAAKEAYEATIADLKAQFEAGEASVTELEGKLAEATEKLAEANKWMEEKKKKEKEEKRKASLIEAGLDEAEATEALVTFDSLDDAAFDAMAGLMKKKAEKKDKKDEETDASDSTEDTTEEADATEVLDDVESTEATLVVSEGESDVEKAQASVAEWFGTHVLNTSK